MTSQNQLLTFTGKYSPFSRTPIVRKIKISLFQRKTGNFRLSSHMHHRSLLDCRVLCHTGKLNHPCETPDP